MFDPLSLFVISATFIIAGGVKGVIGLGLPTVSLGLLTATLDLPTAMALLIAPFPSHKFISGNRGWSCTCNSVSYLALPPDRDSDCVAWCDRLD